MSKKSNLHHLQVDGVQDGNVQVVGVTISMPKFKNSEIHVVLKFNFFRQFLSLSKSFQAK